MEETPAAVPAWEDGQERSGLHASLTHRPNTPEAVALGQRLAGMVIEYETMQGGRKYQRRGAKLAEFQEAAGRFAADLLRAQASKRHGGRCYRSMRREEFKGPVSYRQFRPLVDGMSVLGLITRTEGYRRGSLSAFEGKAGRGDLAVTEAMAATFAGTPSFLAVAEAVGVTPASVGEHFAPEGNGVLVFLKASKSPSAWNTNDDSPGLIDYRSSARLKPVEYLVDAIEAELVRLNDFTTRFPLTGATHHGFYRTFGMGDRPGFQWDKGGRVISRGNYQTTKKETRLGMTIGSEPVVEIDVEASHLTLAYGLLGVPCESMSGAYEVEGLPPLMVDERDWRRWAVKTWTTVTFGAGRHMSRWPEEHRDTFRMKTGHDLGKVFGPSQVAQAMVSKHPVLDSWGDKGVSWADLQFAESQAIIEAMVSLMEKHDAPSLPIFDSLLVRKSDLGIATGALTDSYRVRCSCAPSLVCSGSGTRTVNPSL